MAFRYIVFNKPYGVLSQFTDEGTGHPTLKDYIPIPSVYAAGRLDRDSEGLLLLTDDGKVISQLTHPRGHAQKVYWVQVEGTPTPGKLEQLERGLVIQGRTTLPCEVRLLSDPGLPPRVKPISPHGPTSWIEIKIQEGKKRQIRHMTASVDLFTLRIIRVAIDFLQLGDLPVGGWRELSPLEIQKLRTMN